MARLFIVMGLVLSFFGLAQSAAIANNTATRGVDGLTNVGSLHFYNHDGQGRVVCFVGNDPTVDIEPVWIPGWGNAWIPLPKKDGDNFGWSGQFHTVFDYDNCSEPKATVVGEITIQSYKDNWDGQTSFDVSAVDNCCDNCGIHWIYPASRSGAWSGCDRFPCFNVYNKPNDPGTVTTYEVDLQVHLGGNCF